MPELDGKVAVVTGCNGILGMEFCKALHEKGCHVNGIDMKSAADGNPYVAAWFRQDITNRKAIDDVLSEVIEFSLFKEVDILVNCAAIDSPPKYDKEQTGLIEDDIDDNAFDRVMATNIKGTVICNQVFGRKMEEHGSGSIINISSIYGELSPDQRIYESEYHRLFRKPIAYCASKAAIPNITRYFATLFKHVRVNTLTFGGVFNNQEPEFVAKYCQKVPMGRMARKDEYNGAVLFLASDVSSYMTGSNLVIDGGYTSW